MADVGKSGKEAGSSPMRRNRSIRSIFMHADGVDKCLMAAGFVGSVVDGTGAPLTIYLMGRMFNNIGASNSADILTSNVREVALLMIVTACGGWVGCFLGEFKVKDKAKP